MVIYQLVTLLLVGVFGYLLLSKIRSRHTIALHRRPENVRRRPWESADYSFMGIPILIDPNVPKGNIFVTNLDGEQRVLVNNIDWSDVT